MSNLLTTMVLDHLAGVRWHLEALEELLTAPAQQAAPKAPLPKISHADIAAARAAGVALFGEAPDASEPTPTSGLREWACFEGIPNRSQVQSAARRIADMALMGEFDSRTVTEGWVKLSDVQHATEDQVAEMIAANRQTWVTLSRAARQAYGRDRTQGKWPPSVVNTVLALLEPVSELIAERPITLLKRALRPLPGETPSDDERPQEVQRLLRVLRIGRPEVLTSLHAWAGHCEWAHPDVKRGHS